MDGEKSYKTISEKTENRLEIIQQPTRYNPIINLQAKTYTIKEEESSWLRQEKRIERYAPYSVRSELLEIVIFCVVCPLDLIFVVFNESICFEDIQKGPILLKKGETQTLKAKEIFFKNGSYLELIDPFLSPAVPIYSERDIFRKPPKHYWINWGRWFGWFLPFVNAYPDVGGRTEDYKNKTITYTGKLIFREISQSGSDELKKETTKKEVPGNPLSEKPIYVTLGDQKPLSLITDSNGNVQIDLNPYLPYLCSGKKINITAQLQDLPEAKPLELSYLTDDVGVDWRTPKLFAGQSPSFSSTLFMKDKDSDGVLEPDEEAEIIMKVKNIGNIPAYNIRVSWDESIPRKEKIRVWNYGEDSIDSIEPGKEWETRRSLQTERTWAPVEKTYQFNARLSDLSQYNHDAASLIVPLRGFSPPALELSLVLKDADENRILDPGETASCDLIVRNIGSVPAFDLKSDWELPESSNDLMVELKDNINHDRLEPNESWTQGVIMKADPEWNWSSQEIVVSATVSDLSGISHKRIRQTLSTRSFQPPRLVLSDWFWDDMQNGVIEPGDAINLRFKVLNEGKSDARSVHVKAETSDPKLQMTDSFKDIVKIKPDASHEFVWNLRIPENYPLNPGERLPLHLTIEEERARYTSQKQDLDLKIGDKKEGYKQVLVTPTPFATQYATTSSPDNDKELLMLRERSYALIIGVNSYDDPLISSLNYAVADARLIFETITNSQYGSCKSENVRLLVSGESLDRQPTRSNILRALNDLTRSRQSDDRLLVFFAGHGDVENEVNYLLSQDTRRDLMFAEGIKLKEEMIGLLDRCVSREQILFVDACHAGTDKRFRDGSGDRGLNVSGKQIEVFKDFANRRDGRIVLSSTDKDQVAQENPRLGHGLFTYFLCEGLQQNNKSGFFNADSNQDGILVAHELYAFIRDKVEQWYKDNAQKVLQEPQAQYSNDGPLMKIAVRGGK